MMKAFEGPGAFGRFARFTDELAAISTAPIAALAEVSSYILQQEVQKVYGDNTKLAHLAQATQDEREALGYTADDPLLRDGSLLRDSVERMHEGLVAGCGSDEPVAAYHEFGYINARTGNAVPARPAFEIGMKEAQPKIEAAAELAVGANLGFVNPAVILESKTRDLVP